LLLGDYTRHSPRVPQTTPWDLHARNCPDPKNPRLDRRWRPRCLLTGVAPTPPRIWRLHNKPNFPQPPSGLPGKNKPNLLFQKRLLAFSFSLTRPAVAIRVKSIEPSRSRVASEQTRILESNWIGGAPADPAAPPVGKYEFPQAPPPHPHQRLSLTRELAADDVSFIYGEERVPAVSHLSLIIPAGNVVALVGPSGAGKSTVADILMGLIAPDSGTLKLDGRPLGPESVRGWRDQIGCGRHFSLS
jgi:hypothetical protein